jgi:hypothetical protein
MNVQIGIYFGYIRLLSFALIYLCSYLINKNLPILWLLIYLTFGKNMRNCQICHERSLICWWLDIPAFQNRLLPSIEDQASDHSQRIGQLRPITIYRLVAKNMMKRKS